MDRITPLTIYILLALAPGDNDAPGISRQIAEDSQSTLMPSESTFYKALKRLVRDSFLTEAPNTPGRHLYRLTPKGRRLLQSESHRTLRLAQVFRDRLR
jgi:DNA-binding PadR family transcriptional regulator